jgi:hypothetical protein
VTSDPPAGYFGKIPARGDFVAAGLPSAVVKASGATPEQMRRHGTAWLDAAEDAGRDAIADDLTPEQLTASIPPSPDLTATPDTPFPYDFRPCPDAGLWWTDGAPLVPAQRLILDTMPDAAAFRAMLDGGNCP